jgi:hypothetical protein
VFNPQKDIEHLRTTGESAAFGDRVTTPPHPRGDPDYPASSTSYQPNSRPHSARGGSPLSPHSEEPDGEGEGEDLSHDERPAVSKGIL